MSLFKDLVETYNRVSSIAGITDPRGHTLIPLHHWDAKSNLEIVIDGNGSFRHASKVSTDDAIRIVIPVTEDSASRTSRPAPHPLFDTLEYLSLNDNRSNMHKLDMYLDQLDEWREFHPKVDAVFKYVLGGTMRSDLMQAGISAHETDFVRFSVELPGDYNPHLWEDLSVRETWTSFCEDKPAEEELCYITGETLPIRRVHSRGINLFAYQAKLISSDDASEFTFRGRLLDRREANGVSAKASHMISSMMRYLIETQGNRCDKQTIVAWYIDDASAAPNPLASSIELHYGLSELDMKEETSVLDIQPVLGTDFAKSFRDATRGLSKAPSHGDTTRRVTIAATDTTTHTSGRMAVTYYQGLDEGDYFERLGSWHESCRWWFNRNGSYYISAPNDDMITKAVYGQLEGSSYLHIKKSVRVRLLSCIFQTERIGWDWVNASTHRASNPFSFSKRNTGFDYNEWGNSLGVACAIARQYYLEKEGEVFPLELDRTLNDRDYLFGRLLAIAERMELDARRKQSFGSDNNTRITNALRWLQVFSAKPFSTWGNLYNSLAPYRQQLNGGEWYQRQIDEVMLLFKDGDFESNKALSAKYLMGYSLQRQSFFVSTKDKEDENAEQ